MPTPNSGESESDFMERCVPMVMDEGHTNEQAVGKCSGMFKEHKMGAKGKRPVIAIAASVAIQAGAAEGDKPAGPAKFTSTFYTGGKLEIAGWDLPVVVDLEAMKVGKVLVANLDHDSTKRVGNFTVANDGKTLVASGTATAKTAARDEVVESALAGYEWQSSLEVDPRKVTEIAAGKQVQVNGQEQSGPFYQVAGTLKGFAFVSHGADDDTTATIAAAAASKKGTKMDAAFLTWVESIGFDPDSLTPEQTAGLQANYNGKQAKKTIDAKSTDPFTARKIEAKRQNDIREIADKFMERRPNDLEYIEAVEKMVAHAIETKMEARDFRSEMYEQQVPLADTVPSPRGSSQKGLNERILMAAICETGRLSNLDKHFKDHELQAARDMFKDGISLNQFFIMAAEANGYRGSTGGRMNVEVQQFAFAKRYPQMVRGGQGFSTIDVANITGAVANKFIHEGWMSVDSTPLRIAAIKPVRNFQLHTTVSLTGALQFEELGPAGEIKHGTLDEVIYTNQAKTYAAMLAITRTDIINDDLGALTAVPRRLGRGAMLLLNHIFWTLWMGLEGAGTFAAGNNNINTGVADMTVGGLDATEVIFMAQTDYDGKPLGIIPKIILVPTALKNKAITLMQSEKAAYATSYATAPGDANPFQGRFTVESSPYMQNSAYTGYSAAEWYMLADPNELAVVEIAALNGRVEPTVDQADTDFNTLGVQYRGYSDVGVATQEKKAGVLADGGSS